MNADDINVEHLDQNELKKFALGNTILFFGCIVYPFGEGLFSFLLLINKLGQRGKWHCLVNKGDEEPVPYNLVGDDYHNLMLFESVSDVTKKFRAANVLTLICMLTIIASFILNYYYNYLSSLKYLKNKIFFIQIGINSMLFLTVLVQFLLCIMFRLSFSGKVCSGDYLTKQQRDYELHNSLTQPIYLIGEGRNLLAIIICEAVLLPAVGLAMKIRLPHLKRVKEIQQLEEEELLKNNQRQDVNKTDYPSEYDQPFSDMSYSIKSSVMFSQKQHKSNRRSDKFNDSSQQIPNGGTSATTGRNPKPHGRGTRQHRDQNLKAQSGKPADGKRPRSRGRPTTSSQSQPSRKYSKHSSNNQSSSQQKTSSNQRKSNSNRYSSGESYKIGDERGERSTVMYKGSIKSKSKDTF